MNAPDIFDEQIEQHAHGEANRELADALRLYEARRQALLGDARVSVEQTATGRVVTAVVTDSAMAEDGIS